MIYVGYVAFAVLFFVLQIVLCFKSSKTIVRLAPFFLILLGYIFALLCANGVFGDGGGFIDGGALGGIIIAIAFSVATAGDLIAWGIYALITKYRKN